jgi:hypothetical protein
MGTAKGLNGPLPTLLQNFAKLHGTRKLDAATYPCTAIKRAVRARGIQNICVTPPPPNHSRGNTKLVHLGDVAIRARVSRHTRTWLRRPSKGKPAQKARFGILPSGGTLRDKAAFSHGVSQSVTTVGAKWNITHKSAVGRQGRSVDPVASHSYIVD